MGLPSRGGRTIAGAKSSRTVTLPVLLSVSRLLTAVSMRWRAGATLQGCMRLGLTELRSDLKLGLGLKPPLSQLCAMIQWWSMP